MSTEVERPCQRFLRAAAEKVRTAGLARGILRDRRTGAVCMLGALCYNSVSVDSEEQTRIEKHIASLLPPRPDGDEGYDKYNEGDPHRQHHSQSPGCHIAWWSNMRAKDAEEVARKFEQAAESC